MEVCLEEDVQGSPGEGSSPEEDSGHGHVGFHPGSLSVEMQQAHKCHMLERFQCLMEGLTHQGNSTLLRKIYTDLYITDGEGWGVNEEHEITQIERGSFTEDRTVKCSDIFKQLSEQLDQLSNQDKPSSEQVKWMSKQGNPIGVVLTKGVAGIGKTVSVQKFILDWADGTSNQDVDFIFPLPFRELNLMKEKNICLIDVIRHFFPDARLSSAFTSSESRVMFIFDGLDESRLPLNFCSNPECCDVTKSVPVDVLLTNLIKGKMLPSALLWITTRPAAANKIPSEYVNQVTEIRGFNDPQKEEYFWKKLSDESLASRTIAHLKSSRSLYIMCHIPVFSWILATVVERTSDGSGSVDMPRTLTQMYTHFLINQIRIKNTKYTESDERDEEMISKLGKLAFQQLGKGNMIFYEGDLIECGIDVAEASVYSGVCTQIFREEAGLYQGKVFSFVHLSIQEFLAALYVFLCFISRERKMPSQQQTSQLYALFRAITLHDLHKTAVDLALQSENGHLDLFLRFLLGLSLESNQSLLSQLLPQTSSQLQSSGQTVQCIKEKIRQQKESDRRINLFYCLNELNQHAVVEHIDRSSGTLSVEMLLPGQWKTGKFNFETSEEYLDGFDMQKYIKTPEMDHTDLLSPDDILQKLVPSDVFTSSISAELWDCPLSEKSCSHLSSALTSSSSHLTQLTLECPDKPSSSSLDVSSSAGCHPDCKPWELRLWGYNLTEEICNMVSALTSHTSTLSGEHLRIEEGERLCSTLSHQDCRLEKIELEFCPLSEKSCSHLSSALTSHSSRDTKLQLNVTDKSSSSSSSLLTVSSLAGCHPDCKPWELRLEEYNLTEEICSYLVSALTSHTSRLYGERLGREEEVERLCSTLSHQDCRLEKLELEFCPLSEKSCSRLSSALTSNSSRLTQLTLEGPDRPSLSPSLHVSSSAGCHPDCKPWELSLKGYNLTEEICSYLVSALTSHTSTLSGEDLEEEEVERLCSIIYHQDCRLEKLQLEWCPLSEKSCFHLSSALTSHSSRLTQLELNVTIPDKTAAEKLIALQNDPHYQMKISWSPHPHLQDPSKLLNLSCRALDVAEVTTPSAHHQQHSQEVSDDNFLKENPEVVDTLASASSSHSSDAAEMNLTDSSQQHIGAQLPSLRQGRICQTCADIQDPGHWCVMTPSISLESGECVYTVSSAAGSYECSESGLRWSCAGPVTLQYRISKEELFWAQLQMLGYRPAGPLMEIKLLSGELEEVYLPHSLCLGGSDPVLLGDAVRALHGDDSGVSLETCELSRFHGRLSAQHFSVWEMVASWGVPMKSHCEVLLYEHCSWPLVLHTYLLPSPSSARQAVESKWSMSKPIDKPNPKYSLWIDSTLQLTSPDSLEIEPSDLTLTYRNPPTYSEVYLENPLPNFKMEIKTGGHTVWKAMLRQGVDYLRENDSTNSVHTPQSNTAAAADMTEQQLMKVARLMGGEWKQVGILYLGLSIQELDKIQESERDNVTMQRFRMLDQWRRQHKGKAGVSELYCCLDEDDVPTAVRDCLEGMLESTSVN